MVIIKIKKINFRGDYIPLKCDPAYPSSVHKQQSFIETYLHLLKRTSQTQRLHISEETGRLSHRPHTSRSNIYYCMQR